VKQLQKVAGIMCADSNKAQQQNQESWHKMDAETKFAAAWEMVAVADLMRDGTGNVPRLRRDVARLVRLKDADSFLTTTKLFLGKQ
jgi:hypothetical protein